VIVKVGSSWLTIMCYGEAVSMSQVALCFITHKHNDTPVILYIHATNHSTFQKVYSVISGKCHLLN